MKIINRLYNKWPPETRKRLRSISLRSEGDMCKAIRHRPCDSFVVFHNGAILGWAIYVLEPWYHDKMPGDFMIYVKKLWRRKGIGRALIKAGLAKYKNIRIHPWNENSGRFFSKIIKENKDIVIARGRAWLTIGD